MQFLYLPFYLYPISFLKKMNFVGSLCEEALRKDPMMWSSFHLCFIHV